MRTRLLAVSSCCGPLLAILGGCSMINLNEPPWGYVKRVGDARAIAGWTLQQVEFDRIQDGQLALLNRALDPRFGTAEHEAAAEGYLRVHRHGLAGWPVSTAPPRDPPSPPSKSLLSLQRADRDRFIEIIVQASFDWVVLSVDGQRSEAEMRLLRSLYLQMRPDPEKLDHYKYWVGRGRQVGLLSANDD